MRLFVAVPLTDDVKRRMLRVGDQISVPGSKIRWLAADQLHLTLKFIGDVQDSLAQAISDAVVRVGERTPAFSLEVSGTGCFPPRGPVRVIWVGGSEDSGSLLKAVQLLEQELEPLGIAREKRTFSEHFTIGRVKVDHSRGTLRESVLAARFTPCRQRVTQLILYESTLAQRGAQYTSVCQARLNGSL